MVRAYMEGVKKRPVAKQIVDELPDGNNCLKIHGRFACRSVLFDRSVVCENCAAEHRTADSHIGEAVGLGVVLPTYVGYREDQRASQFAAGPVEGIEAVLAALVFAPHLLHHYLRI
jgi:hypothetical protein